MKGLIALLLTAVLCAETTELPVAPLGAYKPFEKKYWAFQPRKDVAASRICGRCQTKAWVKTPIDAFILDGLKKAGLKPAPQADRLTLIRRVTYDLTGLPPTPEEIDAFVTDKSARRLGKGGGPAAGFAALRRAVGPALAGRGPFCRIGRL